MLKPFEESEWAIERKANPDLYPVEICPPPRVNLKKDVLAFAKWWYVEFRKAHGSAPVYGQVLGVTWNSLADMINDAGIEEIKLRAKVYFQNEFWKNRGFPIQGFADQIDQFLPVIDKPRTEEKFASNGEFICFVSEGGTPRPMFVNLPGTPEDPLAPGRFDANAWTAEAYEALLVEERRRWALVNARDLAEAKRLGLGSVEEMYEQQRETRARLRHEAEEREEQETRAEEDEAYRLETIADAQRETERLRARREGGGAPRR